MKLQYRLIFGFVGFTFAYIATDVASNGFHASAVVACPIIVIPLASYMYASIRFDEYIAKRRKAQKNLTHK